MITCEKCNMDTVHDDAKFCSNCGASLSNNYCSNNLCDVKIDSVKLDSSDCFCYLCGSKTTYFLNGKATPKKYLPF